jgi:hypothetical protein
LVLFNNNWTFFIEVFSNLVLTDLAPVLIAADTKSATTVLTALCHVDDAFKDLFAKTVGLFVTILLGLRHIIDAFFAVGASEACWTITESWLVARTAILTARLTDSLVAIVTLIPRTAAFDFPCPHTLEVTGRNALHVGCLTPLG